MRLGAIIRRFFVPAPVVTLFYAAKYRCFISPRAEVELSPKLRIGAGTKIGSFTKIKASDGSVIIGSRVSIATGCSILGGEKGVVLGDDCLVSPNVVIVGSNYRFDDIDLPIRKQEVVSKGISIGRNVWIGAGCVIRDGSTIGDGTIIAPLSVVSTTLPGNAVCQGNPAKMVFARR